MFKSPNITITTTILISICFVTLLQHSFADDTDESLLKIDILSADANTEIYTMIFHGDNMPVTIDASQIHIKLLSNFTVYLSVNDYYQELNHTHALTTQPITLQDGDNSIQLMAKSKLKILRVYHKSDAKILYLSSLKIKDHDNNRELKVEPPFDKIVLQYQVFVPFLTRELDIIAHPIDSNAKVKLSNGDYVNGQSNNPVVIYCADATKCKWSFPDIYVLNNKDQMNYTFDIIRENVTYRNGCVGNCSYPDGICYDNNGTASCFCSCMSHIATAHECICFEESSYEREDPRDIPTRSIWILLFIPILITIACCFVLMRRYHQKKSGYYGFQRIPTENDIGVDLSDANLSLQTDDYEFNAQQTKPYAI